MIEFNTLKSYFLFFLSLVIMGLGISLVTLAHLGTTPITSPPYVLSLFLPVSFGMLTMVLNFLFVLIQVILLRQEFPKIQYLQLLVGPILGISIDLWSALVTLVAQLSYLIQLNMVIVGSVIIALSTVLQLKAQVVNNPAEGIVKAIAIKSSKEFGTVKFYFDIILVLLAAVISFIALGTIQGIREGTIISVLIIGPLIKMFQKRATNK
ncbi:YitT family protein [Paraliobacillus sp. JSM ZJ581]|uniref:YczE/YyaS/YitT family protein n=1 Tax=Paraliobacillus sp. JSM ZJ581 TaxID=3342118 RepID=UPI0035A9250F